MKTLRDVSGTDLVKALRSLGYERIRQESSHVTVPNHQSLRVGAFTSILKLIAAHHGLTVDELLKKNSNYRSGKGDRYS